MQAMNTEAIRKVVDNKGIKRYQRSLFQDIIKIYNKCPGAVTKSNQQWIKRLKSIFDRYGLLSKNQSNILLDIRNKARWRSNN